jgi:hypothetical protein
MAFKYYENEDIVKEGIIIGAILSTLNGMLNGIFYGFNEGSRKIFMSRICGTESHEIEMSLISKS